MTLTCVTVNKIYFGIRFTNCWRNINVSSNCERCSTVSLQLYEYNKKRRPHCALMMAIRIPIFHLNHCCLKTACLITWKLHTIVDFMVVFIDNWYADAYKIEGSWWTKHIKNILFGKRKCIAKFCFIGKRIFLSRKC